MSRVFRAAGAYEPELEAAVARAVDACRRDRWFRAEEVSPKMRLVPDFMVLDNVPDNEEVIVVVTTTSQLKDTIAAMQRVLDSPTPSNEHERPPGQ